MMLPPRTSSARYKSGATVVARQIAPTPDTPEEISVSFKKAAVRADRRPYFTEGGTADLKSGGPRYSLLKQSASPHGVGEGSALPISGSITGALRAPLHALAAQSGNKQVPY